MQAAGLQKGLVGLFSQSTGPRIGGDRNRLASPKNQKKKQNQPKKNWALPAQPKKAQR
jgi:hypothetical protein